MQHTESLAFKTSQNMIDKLLTCPRIARNVNVYEYKDRPYTKKDLAKKLLLSIKQIDELGDEKFYTRYCEKISLPLIKLFCATKFYEDDK